MAGEGEHVTKTAQPIPPPQKKETLAIVLQPLRFSSHGDCPDGYKGRSTCAASVEAKIHSPGKIHWPLTGFVADEERGKGRKEKNDIVTLPYVFRLGSIMV